MLRGMRQGDTGREGGMMLLYVGNFRPSWSTETYVARSFENIGELVVRLQEDEVDGEQVLQAASRFNADWLLYTRTWGVKDGLAGGWKMIEGLRRKGITTATLSLDLYWGLNREEMIHEEPMWRTDIVFTADGGRDADWKAAGVNHAWLPPAVYEGECWRGHPQEKYKADVIFVGSFRAYHKEWPFRQELVRGLADRYGARFQHWGDARYVRGWDLNDLYASAKIVVGDSLARPKYWSDRVPETLGRGGFLLTPEIEGMEQEGYLPRRHLLYYRRGDLGDCIARIDETLFRAGTQLPLEQEREEIITGGMALVKSRHTYAHRARGMLDAIRDHRAGRERPAVDFQL
jgi:hypothetical protein